MNINDPFGRMDARQERDYQSLRHSLQRAGLTDPDEAEAQIARLRRRGVIGIAITVPLTLVLIALYPEAKVVFLALAALSVAWILNVARKGQTYLRRYIDEELKSSPRPPADEQ